MERYVYLAVRYILAIGLAIGLSGCSIGSLVGAPTPEPWTPPPTPEPTAVAVVPTPTEPAVVERTVAVAVGTFADRRELSGQVTPVLERGLAFRQSGVLRNLYVEVGAQVQTGQLLAEIDLGTLEDQLRQAKINAEQDRRTIEQATARAQIEVRAAEVALESARDRLAELTAPASPTEIAEARAALQRAEAALARARNDASAVKTRAERTLADRVAELQRVQEAYGNARARLEVEDTPEVRALVDRLSVELRAAESAVALAQIELDTARGNEIAAVQAAEADVTLARTRLERLLNGPDPFEVAAAQRAVQQAQIQLDAARQRTAPDPLLVKSLAASELAIKSIERQIEDRRIYAPFDGSITAIEALVGFPVEAEVPVLRLMDNSGLQVTVSGLSSDDLQRIPDGARVAVQFVRYPGRTFSGVVRKTITMANPLQGTELQIACDCGDLPLVIGDPALVTIDFGQREGARWLPLEAIRRDGGTYVLVPTEQGPQRVDVQIGLVADGKVEIISGLEAGDLVILPVSGSN
ncbi:biotin/lipoyl-binding protein [Chloroflexus sp.]|uniref:biotin/lipoyl-binding protein n=1 Tax=Chloroflexus sp. TaxID=1904827 RepID=UPI0026244408|nr:efflux RND transporter periplasmic adaptor subunit [uncultured Chloroflexus sp.]